MKSTIQTNKTNTALCGLISGLLLLAAGNTNAHAGLMYSSAAIITKYDTSPPANLGQFAVSQTDRRGVAVDGAGNVYSIYGNGGANQTLTKITPGGTESILGTFSSGNRDQWDLAVDSAGNIYSSFLRTPTIAKWTSAGGAGSVFTSGGALNIAGVDAVRGLAIDSADNLYVAVSHNLVDGGFSFGNVQNQGAATFSIEKYSSTGSYLGQFASGLDEIAGLTFDASGNLYAATYRELLPGGPNTSNTVMKYTSGGAGSVFATFSSGSTNSRSGDLDFDELGNLYVADYGSGGFIQEFSSVGADLGHFAVAVNNPFMAIDPIPEPTSALLLLGSGAMLLLRRRRTAV